MKPEPQLCIRSCACVPGGEDLRSADVGHDVQEVVAHEDSPLQEQRGKTDAVPDDPGLVARQLALFILLLLRCAHTQIKTIRTLIQFYWR